MSIIQLDSLVPASLSGSLKTNKEILTAMYVNSNDGNKILNFCARINKILNLTNNTTNNKYGVFYVDWIASAGNPIYRIANRSDMLSFIRLLHNPNVLSQKFSQLVNLLQAFDTYNRKSAHMIQRHKQTCCYGVPEYKNGIRNGWHISIDSFVNNFFRYNSIDFS